MSSLECPETNMFAGSSHQSFQGAGFNTAGRDMAFMPTVNVNLAATVPTVAISTDGPSTRLPLPISNSHPPDTNPMRACRTSPSTTTRILRPLARFLGQKERRRPSHHDHNSSQGLSVDTTSISANGTEGTSQRSASSWSFFHNDDDISLSSAEDLDSFKTVPNAAITRPEVYIRNMLRSGKGLASWHPQPCDPVGERGVVPGDVGTFSAQQGFKKIFNLQEDEAEIMSSKFFRKDYPLPRTRVVKQKDELSVGDTIASGISAKTRYAPDGGVASYRFRMLEPEGAVLALTSSADLEEFHSNVEPRDFIIHNAASIYRCANSVRRLDDHESLYTVTGCIKSDSWAVAAYNDRPDQQNDVLRLIRSKSSGSTPTYVWTDRGTAEARFGSTRNGGTHKDQCLFLRGFKVAYTPAFRSKMKGSLSKSEAFYGGEGESGSDSSDEYNRKQGDSSGNRTSSDRSSEARRGGPGSTRRSQGGPSDEPLVEHFPNRRTEDELHPCDRINMQLLHNTTADTL